MAVTSKPGVAGGCVTRSLSSYPRQVRLRSQRLGRVPLRRVVPAGVLLAGLAAVVLLYEPRREVPWVVLDRERDYAIIEYQHGHCERLRYVDVSEKKREIQLRVIVSETSYTCQLNLEYSKVRVDLGSSTKELIR